MRADKGAVDEMMMMICTHAARIRARFHAPRSHVHMPRAELNIKPSAQMMVRLRKCTHALADGCPGVHRACVRECVRAPQSVQCLLQRCDPANVTSAASTPTRTPGALPCIPPPWEAQILTAMLQADLRYF